MSAPPKQVWGGKEVDSSAFLEGAEALLGLKFATWNKRVTPLEQNVEPASSMANSGTSSFNASVTKSCRQGPKARRRIKIELTPSDEDSPDDEEYRPAKVRVIHTGTSGTPIVLPRRSYTWRGASRRHTPQEEAAESTVELEHCGKSCVTHLTGSAVAADPHNSDSLQLPATATGSATSTTYPDSPSVPAAPGCSIDTKEGDKEWAALTTWLRMNLHNPRTCKKVVLFMGQRAADGHWSFGLNPLLSWEDLSLDTKLRLRDLLQETQAAFKRKYPNRPATDWRKKSQKYRAPGSSQTFQVPLDDLVMSLHHMYQRHEQCPLGAGVLPSGSTSMDSSLTAEEGLAQGKLASPTISHNS